MSGNYFMIFIMELCLFPLLIQAETGYVTDRLILSFRQGPDKTSEVIKPLLSDTPVIILEEKNEFYKIELQSKEIGWVGKNYISFELPKTVIIDQLKKENDELKNQISELNLQIAELKKLKTNLLSEKNKKYDELIKNDKKIQKIIQENKSYQKENLNLSGKLKLLETKNDDLFKTGLIKWFLSGVGVLLLGWLLGMSVSSKRRKSNSLIS